MRRALSIFMIVLLGLAPLAAMVPGGEDPRLPLCCRRQGAHHCAMSFAEGASAAAFEGTPTSLKAPSTCSQYPGVVAANVGAMAFLSPPVVSVSGSPSLVRVKYVAGAFSRPRAQTSRGPPCALLDFPRPFPS